MSMKNMPHIKQQNINDLFLPFLVVENSFGLNMANTMGSVVVGLPGGQGAGV